MAVPQNAESLQQHLLEEVVLVLAILDDAFGDHLAGLCAQEVEIRIIHFEFRLALEPADTHEETVDDTCAVFFAASFLREEYDVLGDDLGVGSGDLRLFELKGDGSFNAGEGVSWEV